MRFGDRGTLVPVCDGGKCPVWSGGLVNTSIPAYSFALASHYHQGHDLHPPHFTHPPTLISFYKMTHTLTANNFWTLTFLQSTLLYLALFDDTLPLRIPFQPIKFDFSLCCVTAADDLPFSAFLISSSKTAGVPYLALL